MTSIKSSKTLRVSSSLALISLSISLVASDMIKKIIQELVQPIINDEKIDKLLGIKNDFEKININGSSLFYQGTPYSMLLDALNYVEGDKVIVDLGSGYGRALVVGSMLSKKIYGIEISKKLYNKSMDILDKLGLRECDVVNADVTDCRDILQNADVLFMYNPFPLDKLKEVLWMFKTIALKKQVRIMSLGICNEELEKEDWIEVEKQFYNVKNGLTIYKSKPINV